MCSIFALIKSGFRADFCVIKRYTSLQYLPVGRNLLALYRLPVDEPKLSDQQQKNPEYPSSVKTSHRARD